MPHPLQPVEKDPGGTIRFKGNAIVRYLLDTHKNNLNDLACMPFSNEDRMQFAQLLGYSVCGFCDLSYVSDAVRDAADAEAESFLEAQKALPPLEGWPDT